MVALVERRHITLFLVEGEIALLKEDWQITAAQPELNMGIGLFDRRRLEAVLKACCRGASLSGAEHELPAVSWQKRTNSNDTDRLQEHLARFGLNWESVRNDQIQQILPHITQSELLLVFLTSPTS